ncbi:helix-turn-helix transcriptional regulator [Tengunoibacter tsumagoiensis]|uniref:DeoR family transcriptional regulator n=1 Tax=Tengunoibacter tsumagoiensis TaxID=2014871 RepID=A0A402A6S0_9CHLR|nr:YafY family protein [Tengunoibacter tsumagoiensis]GCE14818.1 DeoR family transcriptional regulator [Tengunoibacter tsumagoiensis]
MNRVDRLTAILLLLQTKRRTAGEMAQHFEVSRRTIQRDIDALCEMGLPIMSGLGVSGGYSLPADYSLPPLALTLHEALLLRLAVSSVSKLSETPFKQERESLLAKVQTLLPRRERESLDQFAQTLSLDVPTQPYPTPFLDLLLKNAREEQWIAVNYRSEKGISQQTLLPKRLRTEVGLWYCDAYSLERKAMRVYRVDRFLDVKAAPLPPQLEQPESTITHVHPSFPEICIHLTSRGVLRLEHQPHLASRLQQTGKGEGWLKLHLRPDEYDWLVRILLSLGTDATVHAPEALRLRVQQAALEIASHYTEM